MAVDTSHRKSIGFFPLRRAAQQGHPGTARTLLDLGADVNALSGDGRGALAEAAAGFRLDDEEGALEVMRVLLDAGANPNPSTHSGSIPLTNASTVAKTRLLLERGAVIDARDETGQTALIVSALHDKAEKARVLVDAGARLDFKSVEGWTAMDAAVGMKHEATARVLSLAKAPQALASASSGGCALATMSLLVLAASASVLLTAVLS